jgi:hypothetical protein
VRILLLSDLHAFAGPTKDGSVPSYADAKRANPSPGEDALVALKELVTQNNLQVDLVVCAGDLGDKADPTGITYAWASIQSIAAELRCQQSVAVCGNHDLDSRYLANTDDPDPKGVLQDLNPAFPVNDDDLCDKFWSRNFVTLNGPSPHTRLLLLNTSAYHGGKQDEINHGRITFRTVERIRRALLSEGRRNLNVMICHHHPFPHSRLDGRADYEAMRNGQSLLDVLGDPTFGPWLILHGHRHHPRIAFSSGANSPPIVIGAASFSAKMGECANQVHLVEVDNTCSFGYDICGTVTSWTFSYGTGFMLMPKSTNALPGHCGFGFKGNLGGLIQRIHDFIHQSNAAYVEWRSVASAIIEVDYLTPEQFGYFHAEMKAKGIQLLFDDEGVPLQAYGLKP